MKGDQLPDPDHVSRLCSRQRLNESGEPLGSAFLPRENDDYLSVFWLERTGRTGRDQQLVEIRRRMQRVDLKLRVQSRIAVLQIGRTRAGVQSEIGKEIRVLHEPVGADGREIDDTHAGIHGITPDDLELAECLARLTEEVVPACPE